MTHACNAMPTVVGVVLAAGSGSRLGRPKILVDDWLARSVAALAAGGCDRVLVTQGAATVDPPAPAESVVVADWRTGMSASLRAAVHAARAGGALTGMVITLVDLPDVHAAVVARVVRRAAPDALVRAVFEGRPGHPVFLGANHLDGMLATLTGDRGAGPYLARHDVAAVECGDLATGRDVDHA